MSLNRTTGSSRSWVWWEWSINGEGGFGDYCLNPKSGEAMICIEGGGRGRIAQRCVGGEGGYGCCGDGGECRGGKVGGMTVGSWERIFRRMNTRIVTPFRNRWGQQRRESVHNLRYTPA